MKNLLIIFLSLSVGTTVFAQELKKVETVEIKTSAVCGMCKNTIETELFKMAGIKSASLDVPSKVLTVIYKTSKVSAEEIRKAITLVGYDADDIPADAVAYENLHFCCKKDSH